MMTRVRVKGFKIFTDRHGKPRCYHRKTGLPIDLVKHPIGSAGFIAECERISAREITDTAAKPGTLGLLISAYRASDDFLDKAPRTRRDYQRVFDYLRPIDDTPLIAFRKALVVRIRDKAARKHGRRFGTYVKQVLSIIFEWGEEREMLDGNPAKGVKAVKRPRNAPRANRPWTDRERFAVLEEAPPQLKVPIAIMMYTGLDPGDAITLTRSECDGRHMKRRRGKTGEWVSWRLPEALYDILADAPPHDAVTVAVTSRGVPWTGSGLRASWRTFKIRLEAENKIGPGLTLKGLRHTVATFMSEEGFNTRTIADALGQRTEAMAQHYSRDADLTRKMSAVVEKFDEAETRRRTEFVKPDGKKRQTEERWKKWK